MKNHKGRKTLLKSIHICLTFAPGLTLVHEVAIQFVF